MCIICKDWQSGKMTSREALRAVGEMMGTSGANERHLQSVVDKIMEKESPEGESNPDLDEEWERNRGGD